MKYISLIIIIYLFTSCHSSSKKEIFCIKDVSYDSREMALTPALIKIIIKDHNGIISKEIKANLVKDIIFYSIEKQDRFYFKKGDYYEEKDGD
ncbi:hypothetical protein, partial [Flavobacterium sp. '19STA2R22 D10 B1']|uniref:hypothetical protein n=1 Tax=Flavobacterium aerium TaxID=3037261 RepID=UPI00278BF12F